MKSWTDVKNAWRVMVAFGAAVATAGIVTACGSGESPQPVGEETGQTTAESIRPPVPVQCPCLSPTGQLTTVLCSDTCFAGSAACGSPTDMCGDVCRYVGREAVPGTACETYRLGATKVSAGVCATGGINGDLEKSGCCADCLSNTKDVICGTASGRCGSPGKLCPTTPLCTRPAVCEMNVCAGTSDCKQVPVPSATECGDGGQCWDGACCEGCMAPGKEGPGRCQEGTSPKSCGSGGGVCQNCDDGVGCTIDTCENGVCVNTPDDSECTNANQCTAGKCDPDGGCMFEPVSGSCDDVENLCTINGACQNGECALEDKVCDDGNPCTEDGCDPSTGCVFRELPDDTVCDDGSSCTSATTCQGGECVGTGLICHCGGAGGDECDASHQCRISTCDGNGNNCAAEDKPDDTPCDDGDACTDGDSCQQGVCVGGAALDCDDKNPCTSEACEAATGCAYTNVVAECIDGDICTTGDRCVEGTCVGTALECEASDTCHEAGSCDSASGLCTELQKRDGTACGNEGECQSGVCEGEIVGIGGTNSGTGGGAGEGNGGSAGDGEGGDPGMGGTGGGVGGDGGTGGELFDGEEFVRSPEGCSCRTVGTNSQPGSLGLLLGLGLAGAALRRRRWASEG